MGQNTRVGFFRECLCDTEIDDLNVNVRRLFHIVGTFRGRNHDVGGF